MGYISKLDIETFIYSICKKDTFQLGHYKLCYVSVARSPLSDLVEWQMQGHTQNGWEKAERAWEWNTVWLQ